MEEKYLGYIKYHGKSVESGIMDARKSAEALIGLDSALRHFVIQQASELKGVDFEIPVKIQKGSWEVLIPQDIGDWIVAGSAIVTTTYLSTAAKKAAERDFSDKGFKDVVLKSVEAIKWTVKIGKHLGTLTIKRFENAKFTDNNALIGIPNKNGELLYLPKFYLDLFASASPKVLEKIASIIESDKSLAVGTIDSEGRDEVIISAYEKHIFCPIDEDNEDDILFPELKHGDNIVLEGEVTRENKTSNSMGFKYLGHILTAHPKTGSIVPYKPLLFLRCRLHGSVSRLDEKGRFEAKRPKLLFTHLEPLEDQSSYDLFS